MNLQPPAADPTTVAGASSLVVARYRDGQVIKGYTRDFVPGQSQFHVLPRGGLQPLPVDTAELKGVFFVRDLAGNKLFHKKRLFPAFDAGPQSGRRIAVVFEDGELLVGHTQSYAAESPGFFVHPLDPRENNTRVYVLRAATKEVRLGLGAEELARTTPRAQNEDAARRRRILGEG
jgi:hypothetical protein